MKKTSMMIAVMFAFTMMATSAMAQLGQVDSTTYGTEVNIEVAEEVSMWAAPEVDLTLDGKNPENSDEVASTIGHINNVAAQISVQADEHQTGNGETLADVNFFIFDEIDEAEARSRIEANAGAPADAFQWTETTLGEQYDFASVAKSNNVSSRDVVYAASAPNALPDPDQYSLVVTWTIAGQ